MPETREIKQNNMSSYTDNIEYFRKICEENGMTQAQCFDHILEVYALYETKLAAPGREVEIENFEKSVKDILKAYTYSIEVNTKAEGRIREEFITELKSKDKTISDLQEKIDRIQADIDIADKTMKEVILEKERAEKEAATSEKVRIAAEKTAEDKKIIADTLAAKLAEAEAKASGYNELQNEIAKTMETLNKANQTIKDLQRDTEQKISELQRESDIKLKEFQREAEHSHNITVSQLSKVHKEEISSLREKLEGELADLRTKFEKRTDDLMQAKDEIGDLKVQIQKEQTKCAEYERKLNENKIK